MGERHIPHHMHRGAADHKHDVGVSQQLVPCVLQDGGKGGVALHQIRQLVDDQHLALRCLMVGEGFEQRAPVCVVPLFESWLADEICHVPGEAADVQRLRLAGREEVEGGLALDELLYERGLPHATTPVEHDESAFALVLLFENRQLASATNEALHRCS